MASSVIPNKVLATLVEHSHDGILIAKCPKQNKSVAEIIFTNQTFDQLSGHSADGLIGKALSSLYGAKTDKKLIERQIMHLERGLAFQAVMTLYKVDQSPWLVDLHVLPVRNDKGDISHFAAIIRDLTKQQQTEKEIFRLASTDELTGALNRRYFFETAEREFARCLRYGDDLSLAMFEVDNLKAINTQFGHDVGDIALGHISKAIHDTIRKSDLFGRLSGGEFGLLCTNSNAIQAIRAVEKIRQAISQINFTANGTSVKLCLSAGLSERNSSDDKLFHLFKRANDALYIAREKGGDRTLVR